jgi:nucleoid-associated protein YgaU
VWLYFINRKGGGEEAVIPQVTAPRLAESTAGAEPPSQPTTEAEAPQPSAEPESPQPTAEKELASAAPTKKEEEDEFASILGELGGTSEPSKAEKAEEASDAEMAKFKSEAAVTAAPEQTPAPPRELNKDLATLEEQTEKAEQAAKQLNQATEQLLEKEKETTALIPEAETATKETLGSLGTGAAAEKEGAENEKALVPMTPSAEKVPSKPEAEKAFPKTVVVQPGDSLSAIANRVYGDVNKWRLIYNANQDHLKNPNQLLVGMKLTIPAPKE